MITMKENSETYSNLLIQSVYDKISNEINEKTIEYIVNVDLYKSHIAEKKSANFQDYYFRILNNEELYFASSNFFHQFKQYYSLQGIDSKYLTGLEKQKREILKLIRDNHVTKLYFEKFKNAQIKNGDHIKVKDLGSFLSKLVHTFRPDEYCALDNPIRDYFGLTKESFFTAFLIISAGYKLWANDNKLLLQGIRNEIRLLDREQIIKHERLTDLKLLDLIFWSKANR